MKFAFSLLLLISSSPLPVEMAREFQFVAIALEVMDVRECRYLLAKPEDWANDVACIRRRWQELYDAPLLEDVGRWPAREVANELLLFNREYKRQYLEVLLVLYPMDSQIERALDETEQLYLIWDSLRDARCEYYYTHIRRQALKRMRDKLGHELYQAGEMPPAVPVWRFGVIR